VIVDADGNDNWGGSSTVVRQAVEKGAVFLSAPGGSKGLAAAFGVRIPDGHKRGAARRVDLDPLAGLLPGVKGAWLYGQLGPAAGVTPESGLTVADGLIFGRVGKGLFIYVNIESVETGLQGGSGDSTPWDYDGWSRLLLALFARQDIASPARVMDTTGRADRRFACRILDTDDGTQRYLLVQANNVLEGSLSSWGIETREAKALARYAPERPVTLRGRRPGGLRRVRRRMNPGFLQRQLQQ
jgi:hypothetical protein